MSDDGVAVPQPAEGATASAPMVAQRRLKELTASVGQMRTQVESGDLTVDPAAGQEIISMLTQQIDQVDGWLQRASGLARRAPFGQNPVGEAMATKFVDTADSGDLSLTGVLTPYRQVLQEARDAVTGAMSKYQTVEEHQESTFQRILPS